MLLKTFLRKFRPIIITGIVVFVLIIISLLSTILFPHSTDWVNNIQVLLDKHAVGMLVWRLSLLVVLFITWPWVIKHKARIHAWPEINIKRAINLRGYIIVFLLLIDGLFQWSL